MKKQKCTGPHLSRKSVHSPVSDENKIRVPMQLASVFLFALAALSLYSSVFSLACYDDPSSASFPVSLRKFRMSDEQLLFLRTDQSKSDGSSEEEDEGVDPTLRSLLAEPSEFQSDACASRAHHRRRHRQSRHEPQPSRELVQKLRSYEIQHRRCAGRAMDEFLRPDADFARRGNTSEARNGSRDECRYVVWIAYSGMGNRLMTLVSTFLYALLTNRTLLVDGSTDMSELFCEPIPRSSWLLPTEITRDWTRPLNECSPRRFGHKFSVSDHASPTATAEFSYVHLTHTSDDKDQVFFCDRGQDQLDSKPWLFLRSNAYFVPGLLFVSQFLAELDLLFRDKEAVFHLLGRYLLHPSDAVWGWITRFRKAYLADHDRQVGIQVRTFGDTPPPTVAEQIHRCVRNHHLLSRVTTTKNFSGPDLARMSRNLEPATISVLVTSGQQYYYENLRDRFLSGPSEGGESVSVHRLSLEASQKTDASGHDSRAWAEIYLLSLSDVLVTSGWSTVGYCAQALAGIKPWILLDSVDGRPADPPCVQARSAEPCFQTPPQVHCCFEEVQNPAAALPYVQPCEDVPWGIQLITPAPPSRPI
ncbi:hypothetical protein Mp_4g23180 [Marchantia polymorpha subsp. ruderalis]|uniref:Fucosyltransferase n=1 Tax=Marchantia polymorpha subsp. ruderalis TaxID=1480154 RepID=A0AAF6BCW3_MARPO|nr:hypothetical protein Mp_4g23180 [Marchantia polymorpha subsp. ruderalis]